MLTASLLRLFQLLTSLNENPSSKVPLTPFPLLQQLLKYLVSEKNLFRGSAIGELRSKGVVHETRQAKIYPTTKKEEEEEDQ